MKNTSKEEEHLAKLCNSSIKLFNNGDYQALANLYRNDTQFLAPGLNRISSKEGVSDFWRRTFKLGYRFQTIETIELQIDNDLAYWLFSWVMTNPDKNGEIVTQTGKNVLIWRKTNSEWLICLDSWNSPA